jgi:hypothetical protein
MPKKTTAKKATAPEPEPAPVVAAPDETPETELAVEEPKAAAAPEPEPASDGGLDETVPGGRYLVDGKLVNAHGEPIKAKK